MKELVKVEVSGKPEYIPMIKMVAGMVASSEGFDIDCVDDIKLAVGESCKIISCHRRDKWRKKCHFQCLMEEDKMIFIIHGLDSDGDLEKGKRACIDCYEEGDLGLDIIKSVMDDVIIEQGEKGYECIKLVKSR